MRGLGSTAWEGYVHYFTRRVSALFWGPPPRTDSLGKDIAPHIGHTAHPMHDSSSLRWFFVCLYVRVCLLVLGMGWQEASMFALFEYIQAELVPAGFACFLFWFGMSRSGNGGTACQ